MCCIWAGEWGSEGKGIATVGVSGEEGQRQCACSSDCRQGVSCVLPALTCWVELCTDHTCIRALGTVGSEVHANHTNLICVYRCWQAMFSLYLYSIKIEWSKTLAIALYTVVKQPQQSNKDVLTVTCVNLVGTSLTCKRSCLYSTFKFCTCGDIR